MTSIFAYGKMRIMAESLAQPASHEVPLLAPNDPMLRAKLPPFNPNRLGTPELETEVATMMDTLIATGLVGLAANQVGIRTRMIGIVENWAEDDAVENPMIMIDPHKISQSEETEGNIVLCGSMPGVIAWHTYPVEMLVGYFDPDGQPRTRVLHRRTVETFDHETGHLDGLLIPDPRWAGTVSHVAKIDTADEDAQIEAYKADREAFTAAHPFKAKDFYKLTGQSFFGRILNQALDNLVAGASGTGQLRR